MADNKEASQVLTTTPDQVVISRAPPTGLTPLRHSQLSDSGAESCYDGDEQARLIRSSSSRAHKFIIIPATPGTPPATGTRAGAGSGALPFRQTSSTTSLVAMANALHKQPPLRQISVKSRPSSEVLQPGQVPTHPPTAAGSTSTVTFTIDDCDGQATSAPTPVSMPAISPTPATLTCTTTTTMAGDAVAISPLSMDLRSRIGSHHSSMRSVVSGW